MAPFVKSSIIHSVGSLVFFLGDSEKSNKINRLEQYTYIGSEETNFKIVKTGPSYLKDQDDSSRDNKKLLKSMALRHTS